MDESSYKSRERTLTISLVLTFLSLFPTLYVALISNSLTLFADLLRCLVEFLAILVAFIIARKTRPENLQHYNYGFGKLEHLSSLIVAAALLIAFAITSIAAFHRLFAPQEVQNGQMGLYLGILSVFGNLYIWRQNSRLAGKTTSPISRSQARLFLSKTIACVVVVISLSAGMFFSHNIIGLHADAIGGLTVAAFLFYSSYQIIFHSLARLVDASLEEGAQLLILKSLVKYEASYKNVSSVRTRHGGDKNYIELWLEFDESLILRDIHDISEKICKEIESQIPATEVVIIPLPR
jgi:ferrous-iron efflux pump FieF